MKTKCTILKDNQINEVSLNEFEDGKYEHPLINVYPKEITNIIGFGGAITEASAYCYSLLSSEDKKKVLDLLVGETGLNYNLFRLCIGSSDFTIDEYCYLKQGDTNLSTFSVERDLKYIIPFAKDLISHSKQEIKFLASPWSPPAWFKDNDSRFKGGKLLKECYELYALYLIKFIKAYKQEGININYLTVQNEPKATQTWESCVFTSEDEIELAKVLNKALKVEKLDIKLLVWDHNKERLFIRGSAGIDSKEFAGAGFHWYSGDHFDAISLMRNTYPDSILLETEFCRSIKEDYVDSKYSNEYLNVIKHGSNGLIDWNLILDENGGPYHNRKAGCDAVIKVNSITKEFNINSIYNEAWMFTHFIKPGAVSLYTSSFSEKVKVTAVRNPDGGYVINIINELQDIDVRVFIFDKFLTVPLKQNSVTCIEIKE